VALAETLINPHWRHDLLFYPHVQPGDGPAGCHRGSAEPIARLGGRPTCRLWPGSRCHRRLSGLLTDRTSSRAGTGPVAAQPL